MPKLYEVADSIEKILATCVDHETGEIEEEAAKQLEELEFEKQSVALDIGRYLKGELSEAEAIMAEAEKLGKRAKIHTNRARWLERYLAEHLGIGVGYSAPNCEIGWRKSKAVKVTDESVVPLEFIRVVTSTNVNKQEALKALKRGDRIKGLELEERSTLFVK